jgi:hypothetical protein
VRHEQTIIYERCIALMDAAKEAIEFKGRAWDRGF